MLLHSLPSCLCFQDDVPEEEATQSNLLQLSNQMQLYQKPTSLVSEAEKEELKEAMMAEMTASNMAPFYKYTCKTLGWSEDAELVTRMEAKNSADLTALKDKLEDAKENHGETEVREAQLARADLLAKIGDRQAAIGAYEELLADAIGSGSRIDITFALIRLAFAFNDRKLLKSKIEAARTLVEKGGDWERRNRLGVYDATFLMMSKQFKPAAELFLKATATFTCTELFSYNQFVFYTVMCSMVSLDRVTIRDKVARNPEILAVVDEIPGLRAFIFSLHRCLYRQFFESIVAQATPISRDRFLAPHLGLIVRQLRVVAYSQFLISYKTVKFTSMAASFGVSENFLDREVSRFIAAGRLNCKIDKVSGFIETVRPDAKSAQYAKILTEGDRLLNNIQKLSKVCHFV